MGLLTFAALIVHGYHPFAEDAEIYLPGIEKLLNPALFPVGREFFASHASLTFFPNLIALSLRVTHLPLEAGLFLWHMASLFLLLLACWQLTGILFTSTLARWAGVALVAALFTIPVAGTALYIMDQYLNPRNLAAFCGIFAVTACLQKKYLRAAIWLVLAAAVHPFMSAFAVSFCALLWVIETWHSRITGRQGVTAGAAAFFLLPLSLTAPTSPAYHQAAMRHHFHYIQMWEWYEWLGIVAPLALLWWFYSIARRQNRRELSRLCGSLAVYGCIYFGMAIVIDFLPPQFESLARLQPLRSLHLLYMLMFLVIGGFLGEYVLKNHAWRWLALIVPLSAGMFLAQRALFPQSAHVEWPGVTPKNPWAGAFVWAREQTPENAVFALDPNFMHIAGEDEIGFRCLAERSRLADETKDSGAVSMFPPLAEEWWAEVQAQSPWKNFQLPDFERLKNKYGVNWIVVQRTVAGLECPYANREVRVCRVP